MTDLRQEITSAIAQERYATEPAKLRPSLREEADREADRIMCVVEPIVDENARLSAEIERTREALDLAAAVAGERDRLASQLREARGQLELNQQTTAWAGNELGLMAVERDRERESRFRWAEEAARLEAERREAIYLLVDLQVLECADDAEGKTLADLASMGRQCGWCDGTGVALAASFGRDADGAPMTDEHKPCPEGRPMPEQVTDLMAERDDALSERDKWLVECRQRFTSVVHQCCEDVQSIRASAVVLPEDWRKRLSDCESSGAAVDLVESWLPAAPELDARPLWGMHIQWANDGAPTSSESDAEHPLHHLTCGRCDVTAAYCPCDIPTLTAEGWREVNEWNAALALAAPSPPVDPEALGKAIHNATVAYHVGGGRRLGHPGDIADALLARYDIRERGETQPESEGGRVSAHRLDRIRSVVVGTLMPYDESEGERVRDAAGVVWRVDASSVRPTPGDLS